MILLSNIGWQFLQAVEADVEFFQGDKQSNLGSKFRKVIVAQIKKPQPVVLSKT